MTNESWVYEVKNLRFGDVPQQKHIPFIITLSFCKHNHLLTTVSNIFTSKRFLNLEL